MGRHGHPTAALHDAGPFPPIGDDAFLSDREVSALVAPGGAVEWLCLPRPDAPSVFGALLDRSAGAFRLAPAHALHPSHRRYLPGTMVLETTWRTPTDRAPAVPSASLTGRSGGHPTRATTRRPASP